MKIAVIGAGNVGTALATSMTRAGHEVVISATSEEHARQAAEASGARPARSNVEAVESSDLIVIAVPYAAAAEAVATEIASHVDGKIVIDATNPLTPDYQSLVTNSTSAAEAFQGWLPSAKVAKAFNTVFAARLSDPSVEVDGFVAADDDEAKREVLALIESIGFRPLDAGPLRASRYLEGMAFLNISLNIANEWGWVSTWKLER